MQYTSSSQKPQGKGLPEVFPYVTGSFRKVLILFYLVLPMCTSTTLRMKKAVFCSTAATAETALSMDFIEMQTTSHFLLPSAEQKRK